MNPSIAALGLAALVASCSVFGLTAEEQARLTTYQQTAKYYWEGSQAANSVAERNKHYDQTRQAIRKGLEISPSDYNLLSIQASVQSATNDRQAELTFDQVYAMRSPDDHEPYLLLGYGDWHKRRGVELRRNAEALAKESTAPGLTESVRAQRAALAKEQESLGNHHLLRARDALQALVDRQDYLRYAYKHLMDISAERGDYEEAVEYGRLCLERIAAEKSQLQAVIDTTMSVQDEMYQRSRLAEVRAQEQRTRTALTEMHFRKGHLELSIAQLDVLLENDPQRWRDYYNRGQAHERLGDRDAAKRDYNRFLTTHKLPRTDERVQHAYAFVRQ